jgi:hypothetical protein
MLRIKNGRFKSVERPKRDSSLFDGLLILGVTVGNIFVQAGRESLACS